MDFSKSTAIAHSTPSSRIISLLGSDAAAGLTEAGAAERFASFGPNRIPEARRESVLVLFTRQFRSLLVIVLLVAAAISLAAWLFRPEEPLPYDTLVIAAIVLANAGIGFFQEYRAEMSLSRLERLSGPEAIVVRQGSSRRLPAEMLVPGDLVTLAAGDRVAADARLLEASALETDESSLTGESTPVPKSVLPVAEATPVADRSCMVFAGTAVTAGRGRALVIATGAATQVGQIAELINQAPRRETPLKQNLDQLGRKLALLVLAIAAVVALTGLLVSGARDWGSILDMMLFGVALAVAAIPEGLPAVVTGALALGSQRMARRHALVRRLPAVETLGATTAICSDKTGTLTVGEMTVREIVVPSGKVLLSGAGYRPEGDVSGPPAAREEAARLAISAVLATDAAIEERDGGWQPAGSPTEASLLIMGLKLGIDRGQLAEQNRRIAEQPFSPETKKMTVATTAGGGLVVLHAKGAPETILPLCTRAAVAGGIAPLDEAARARYLKAASALAARSLRPLAVATRPVPRDGFDGIDGAGRELVFLGIAGIQDPPRPEAAAAVQACRRAGIRVYMVTGDHLETARAVATEIGLPGVSMTGDQIDGVSDAGLKKIVDKVRIFARISPGHKVRIVEALQSGGHTVAVTGDGVNDAPALRRADIGVAMGRGGTDIAREAADMVLADDNFATIIAAVEEGRAIFSNIRKVVAYLLSSNAGEVLTLFLGIILAGMLGSGGQRLLLPLLAVQILWINLVTDGLPALALGVNPADPQAMIKPPRPRREPVIDAAVWRLVAVVGSVSALGTLFLLDAYFPGGLISLSSASVTHARTIAFVTLAFSQLFNALGSRRLRHSSLPHLLENRWLLGAIAVSVAMMICVVQVPALRQAFGTEPLSARQWLAATAVASMALWSVELMKAIAHARDWGARSLPLR
ncbi:MAG: cation-translocating P-type ATPase [Thermoleophilia bacterium]